MSKLEEKVAYITGSGRGIGRAVALKLAREGAKVVVNDLDQEPVDEVVGAIEALGGEAIAAVGTVTDPDFADGFIKAGIEAFGGAWTSSSRIRATPGTHWCIRWMMISSMP